MALFAPIGPAPLLRKIRSIWGERVLGKYHLVLAHDVVANRDEWALGRTLPEGSTVIIDNSIIETGMPVDIDMMIEAYQILGDSYRRILVLPDRFDDPERTLSGAMMFLKGVGMKEGLKDAEFMFVIQGSGPADFRDDYLWTIMEIVLNEGVTWFSVPRRIADRFGTRMIALYPLLGFQLKHPQVNIHLLGFSENTMDDVWCALYPGVHGIDSAVPVRLGQRGILCNLMHKGDQAGPRGTFWTDDHSTLKSQLLENLQNMKTWFEIASHNSIPPYKPAIKEEWL